MFNDPNGRYSIRLRLPDKALHLVSASLNYSDDLQELIRQCQDYRNLYSKEPKKPADYVVVDVEGNVVVYPLERARGE